MAYMMIGFFFGFMFGWLASRIEFYKAENEKAIKNAQDERDNILREYSPNEYLESVYVKLENFQKRKLFGFISAIRNETSSRELDDKDFKELCEKYNLNEKSRMMSIFEQCFSKDITPDRIPVDYVIEIRNRFREEMDKLRKSQ